MKKLILTTALFAASSVFAQAQRCGQVQAGPAGIGGGEQKVFLTDSQTSQQYEILKSKLTVKLSALKKSLVAESLCFVAAEDVDLNNNGQVIEATGFTLFQTLVPTTGQALCGSVQAGTGGIAGGEQKVYLTESSNGGKIYEVKDKMAVKLADLKESLQPESLCIIGVVSPSSAKRRSIKASDFTIFQN